MIATTTPTPCTPVTTVPFGSSSSLFVKYQYTLPSLGSTSLPVVADVAGDPHPEIFFTDSTNNLYALQLGTSGNLKLFWWSNPALYDSHVAVARVPNTANLWIVCGMSYNQNIMCRNASDGLPLFTQTLPVFLSSNSQFSGVAIERLFQNDPFNIFVLAPGRVFQYNYTNVVSIYCDIPFSGEVEIPFAVDIDLDGTAEMFYSNCVYSPHCTQLWCAPGFSAGSYGINSAVANMDGDPYGEVVVCGTGRVAVFEHDGTLKWSFNLSMNDGGPPTISDFDGDGFPDVSVLSLSGQYILNGIDGSVLHVRNPITGSGYTSSSSFDFQGDGISEVVSSDTTQLSIQSAAGWSVSTPFSALSASENCVIADIDLDGIADIIRVGDRLTVFSSSEPWIGSGYFWNQHAFNNMNHDSSFYPQVTQLSNSFRSTPPAR